MKIGIIGTGNIAQFLLDEISKLENDNLHIVSLYGRNQEVGNELAIRYGISFSENIDLFLESSIDVVVEAATVEVMRDLGPRVLKAGKHLVISSVGALADAGFYRELEELANENDREIYVPSGAIGGIDLIKSANALGDLRSVSIVTRKSPQSLSLNVEKETVVFEGTASEAIKQFPKNINVSIVLSLAGIGEENTKVTIIADPKTTKNTHTIEAGGEFGRFQLQVENEPMKRNPKTSALAALSILAVLRNAGRRVKIGS